MSLTGIALSLAACGQLTRYPDAGVDADVQPVAEVGDSTAEIEEEPASDGPGADADGDGVDRSDDCDDEDDTVYPGADDPCDDVDSDCDGDDCSEWEDGFESPSFAAPWRTRGDAEWSVGAALAHSGTRSAQSGNIVDLESSILSIGVDTPAGGTVAFWHAESTEATYDVLTFTVDDTELGAWSGESPFRRETFPLDPGEHTLLWTYSKDVSLSAGDDRVRIDDVKIVGGGP